MITSEVTLVMANFVNLSSMSTMGSAGFLLIFAAVNAANVILASETQSKGWLSVIGVGLYLGALGTLLWHTATGSTGQIWVLFAMIGAAFFIETGFRLTTGRSRLTNRDRK